ncbi:MAG: pirin family protein [Anaerolineae bacterium]
MRKVKQIVRPQTILEGAGVRLNRTIASSALNYLDPFLLFDHFGSDDPADYLAGFPMHPHRGIETVTYMLAGIVEHRDSLGNAGSIGAGDVQWMTSGSGIMHEEMPRPSDGVMAGFQLWVNLPAKLKMTTPRYQEYTSELIPEVEQENGVMVRVIAGNVGDVRGPITEIAVAPTYLDISVPRDVAFSHKVEKGHSAFAYVFEGQGLFGVTEDRDGEMVSSPALVVFDDGDRLQIRATSDPVRFLLISGKPLHEPIARYGPFVMNTEEEIQQALRDLWNGTFVKAQPQTDSGVWYGTRSEEE